jgi:hypothetical protein
MNPVRFRAVFGGHVPEPEAPLNEAPKTGFMQPSVS